MAIDYSHHDKFFSNMLSHINMQIRYSQGRR